MQVKKYQLSNFTLEELDDDIICEEFNKNLKIDFLVANQLVSDRLKFAQGKEFYYVINLSNIKHATFDAKFYMQNSETALRNILGATFLASDPVSAKKNFLQNSFLVCQTP
jgi:hypothetical protein